MRREGWGEGGGRVVREIPVQVGQVTECPAHESVSRADCRNAHFVSVKEVEMWSKNNNNEYRLIFRANVLYCVVWHDFDTWQNTAHVLKWLLRHHLEIRKKGRGMRHMSEFTRAVSLP